MKPKLKSLEKLPEAEGQSQVPTQNSAEEKTQAQGQTQGPTLAPIEKKPEIRTLQYSEIKSKFEDYQKFERFQTTAKIAVILKSVGLDTLVTQPLSTAVLVHSTPAERAALDSAIQKIGENQSPLAIADLIIKFGYALIKNGAVILEQLEEQLDTGTTAVIPVAPAPKKLRPVNPIQLV